MEGFQNPDRDVVRPVEKDVSAPDTAQQIEIDALPAQEGVRALLSEIRTKLEARPTTYMLIDKWGEVGAFAERRREIAVFPTRGEAERLRDTLVGRGRLETEFAIEETKQKPDIKKAEEYSTMKPRPFPVAGAKTDKNLEL